MSNQNYNNTTRVDDWGNTIYDGLSGVGSFKADLIMIIALIVGLVLVVVGLYMVYMNDSDDYLNIKGYVIDPNCTKTSVNYDDKGRPIDNYKCNVMVGYNINGRNYTKQMYLTNNSTYIKDEPINLSVSKKDYNNVQIDTMNKSTMGSVMLISALVLVGFAYLNYYLTHQYKIFAAAQGTNTLVGLFR